MLFLLFFAFPRLEWNAPPTSRYFLFTDFLWFHFYLVLTIIFIFTIFRFCFQRLFLFFNFGFNLFFLLIFVAIYKPRCLISPFTVIFLPYVFWILLQFLKFPFFQILLMFFLVFLFYFEFFLYQKEVFLVLFYLCLCFLERF